MTVTHSLSLAIRFLDHFTRRAVVQELPVRLDHSFTRPVRRADGGGMRQADGCYRFLRLPLGTHRILWRDPFQRSAAGWTRWDQPDPIVTLPLADPTTAIEVELWPTPEATTAAGTTGLRGKLHGTGVAGLEIRIAPQGQSFDRMTRSDDAGEFLFLPPGALPLDVAGRVRLTMQVRAPGGAVRPIISGRFQPASAGPAFAGNAFSILPQTAARVLFQLA